MKYGYCRVSSRGQAVMGNSLKDQEKQLRIEGCKTIVKEQYTGTTTHRPELDRLLEQMKSGDTLAVTKLDRLARNAAEGSRLIEQLLAKGIKVHVLNMGLIDNSPIGKVITNVLLAFAQFERDMIVERTQAGKAIARTRAGYREGRRPIPEKKKRLAASLILDQHQSYKETMEVTGLSKTTLIRAVRSEKDRRAFENQ